MQAGQGVKLVFYSPRFVNCDLSWSIYVFHRARCPSGIYEIHWNSMKRRCFRNWSTADSRVVDFFLSFFVVGKQHGEHVFFLGGPSSALNVGTGNMTPWFLFGKIKQPEPSAAWSQIARTYEVEVSAMKKDVALRWWIRSPPSGHFLGVTELQIPSFCNSKFQAAVMNLTRRRMFGSIHLSFVLVAGLVILVYEAQ